MSKYQNSLICEYLDSSKQNASDMLQLCVQDKTKGFDFNCKPPTTNINNIFQERDPITYSQDMVEGFTNSPVFYTDNGPGESIINDKCPESYRYCHKSKKCIQLCNDCKYDQHNKSKEFNEFDPCFPEGVYNGINNQGNINCTCGNNNEYCSDMFTAEGGLYENNHIKNTIGMPMIINRLFSIDQL